MTSIWNELTDDQLMEEITNAEDNLLKQIDNQKLGSAGTSVSLIMGLTYELKERYRKLLNIMGEKK